MAPFAADSFGSAKFVELGTAQKVPSIKDFFAVVVEPKTHLRPYSAEQFRLNQTCRPRPRRKMRSGQAHMNILWIILIGFIAGLIARWLSPGPNDPSGFILTCVLGIVGAFRRDLHRSSDRLVSAR